MAKASKRLTDPGIRRMARAPDGKRLEHFDSGETGLALRITDRGTKSWSVYYYLDGEHRRFTLGRFPDIGVAKARKLAEKAKGQARDGQDPSELRDAEKRARKDERQARQRNNFKAIVAQFIERHAKEKNRGWKETERIFAKYVTPKWGTRSVDSVTKRDIIELVDGVVDNHGPYMANRVLAAVRKLFNWCLVRDIISASPVAGIERPGKEQRRERVLSDEEIRAIWNAADEMGYPFGRMIQLLFLTACRRDEIAEAQQDWLDKGSAVLSIPGEFYKSGHGHQVPLSVRAMEIFDSLPQFAGPFMITTRGGNRPVSGFSVAKKNLDETSGITGWRIHDIRRTVGTQLASLGFGATIKHVLGHADQSVTGIYDRYSYLDEKRRALDAWANKLDAIITGKDAGNIVPLRSAQSK